MKQIAPLLVAFTMAVVPDSQAQKSSPAKKNVQIEEKKNLATQLQNQAHSTGAVPKVMATIQSSLLEVDALTGGPTKSTQPKLNGVTSLWFVGMTRGAGNAIWALSSPYPPNMAPYQSRLMTIDPAQNSLGIGPTLKMGGNQWFCGQSGDLAFDKASNTMYASCADGAAWKLVTINVGTGVVTVKGQLSASGGPYTALAFNPQGALYALDTNQKKLWKLDTTNLANSTSIALTAAPGQQLPNTSTYGAMGFSDAGELLASFGGKFVMINPANGVVHIRGNGDYAGMIVSGGGVTVPKN